MKSLLKILFVVLLAFLYVKSNAQTCGTCSTNITSLDSTSYTVNTGETFCVDTTGNFVGTITLNGGTICNKGLFNPKSLIFTSGTINNNANTSLKSAISVGANSQLNNNPDAIMNIAGSLTVGGGTVSNNGIINVDQNIQNTSGSLTNSSIINCTQISGSGTLNNTGKINTN